MSALAHGIRDVDAGGTVEWFPSLDARNDALAVKRERSIASGVHSTRAHFRIRPCCKRFRSAAARDAFLGLSQIERGL